LIFEKFDLISLTISTFFNYSSYSNTTIAVIKIWNN